VGRVRKEETKKECLLIIESTLVLFYCHVVLFDFGTELGTYILKHHGGNEVRCQIRICPLKQEQKINNNNVSQKKELAST
jgi:hypothetical protein